MTDSRLARRPPGPPTSALRAFGALPAAQTSLSIERALELAGVDPTELALLASTTFKEARTLEELVTLIATTRRRGLDGLLRHVYYERFGGQTSDPSLHVGIDGLRAIAAHTGRYGGGSEPRYSGVWDMPLDVDGHTKVVPEKCTITVWAIVQGRSCAFEGVAFMDEAYPGPGARGRMWRTRPRGMLAIAAERQGLRRAFPSETSGIGDYDDSPEAEPPAPPPVPVGDNARKYDRIFGEGDLVEHAGRVVDSVSGEVLESTSEDVQPAPQAAVGGRPVEPKMVTSIDDKLYQRYSTLAEEAAGLDVPFVVLELPLPVVEVTRLGNALNAAIAIAKAKRDQPAPTTEALI